MSNARKNRPYIYIQKSNSDQEYVFSFLVFVKENYSLNITYNGIALTKSITLIQGKNFEFIFSETTGEPEKHIECSVILRDNSTSQANPLIGLKIIEPSPDLGSDIMHTQKISPEAIEEFNPNINTSVDLNEMLLDCPHIYLRNPYFNNTHFFPAAFYKSTRIIKNEYPLNFDRITEVAIVKVILDNENSSSNSNIYPLPYLNDNSSYEIDRTLDNKGRFEVLFCTLNEGSQEILFSKGKIKNANSDGTGGDDS